MLGSFYQVYEIIVARKRILFEDKGFLVFIREIRELLIISLYPRDPGPRYKNEAMVFYLGLNSLGTKLCVKLSEICNSRLCATFPGHSVGFAAC